MCVCHKIKKLKTHQWTFRNNVASCQCSIIPSKERDRAGNFLYLKTVILIGQFFSFLVPLMIPKVCENKGKHRHFLLSVSFAIFKDRMLFPKLPPTKCKELGRGERKWKPSGKGQDSSTPSTSEKMLIGTRKIFLLLKVFHYVYCEPYTECKRNATIYG